MQFATASYGIFEEVCDRRGYEDGYGRRHKYGSVSNGTVAILAAVVAGIIVYEVIR